MSESIRIGFISAGKRARTLMTRLYTLRDEEYFLCDRDDNWPDAFYHEFSEAPPAWLAEVSGLHPEITAVMNPGAETRETARSLCQEHGDDPVMHASLDEFLQEGNYDAVIVASPNDKHVDAVLPLLDAGTDLLCEKPLASSLEDHDRIIEAEAAADALLYVGFQRRVAPYYQNVKALIERGTIGRLGMMSHVETRDPFQMPKGPTSDGFRFSKDRSGGALLEKNSHDFDLFNWYSDSNPVKVSAFGGQHVFNKNTDIVDQATVNVEYEGGIIASLELCLYNGVGADDIYGVKTQKRSEFRGSEGMLRFPDESGVLEVYKKREQTRRTIESGGIHSGDIWEMKHFLECVQGSESPPATARDAKKAAAVCLAAERSIAQGGTVVHIDSNYDLVA